MTLIYFGEKTFDLTDSQSQSIMFKDPIVLKIRGMIQNNVDLYYHFYTVQFIVNKIT